MRLFYLTALLLLLVSKSVIIVLEISNIGVFVKQKNRLRSGFTALELIIVIFVLAILAALLYKPIAKLVSSSGSASLNTQLSQIENGLKQYYLHTGTYPCNIKYLWENPAKDNTPDAKNIGGCYDALSLVAGGDQDQDVLTHWSGPYLEGVEVVEGTGGNNLKANMGQSITIGANVSEDGTVTPLSRSDTVKASGDATQVLNVITISGLQTDQVKSLYQQTNGRSIEAAINEKKLSNKSADKFSDAWEVAREEVPYKLGVPKAATSADKVYVIYRWTTDFSGYQK